MQIMYAALLIHERRKLLWKDASLIFQPLSSQAEAFKELVVDELHRYQCTLQQVANDPEARAIFKRSTILAAILPTPNPQFLSPSSLEKKIPSQAEAELKNWSLRLYVFSMIATAWNRHRRHGV